MIPSVVFKREDPELRIVWGEVYAPNRPDADGEFMDAETIRKMAYDFMVNKRLDQVDHQHQNKMTAGVAVVESFVARKGDPDFIEGSWVAGVHIPDDTMWGKVQKGEINGFSIEAFVNKSVVDVELEIPSVIGGMTMKSEGHEHGFLVRYDPNGKFLGGRTDSTGGHTHEISRGTITEIAAGHQHRFSHVEGITLREV
jgi:hypothetical protein